MERSGRRGRWEDKNPISYPSAASSIGHREAEAFTTCSSTLTEISEKAVRVIGEDWSDDSTCVKHVFASPRSRPRKTEKDKHVPEKSV